MSGDLKESGRQLCSKIDQVVRLLNRGIRGPVLRKAAQEFDAKIREFTPLYKAARNASLQKLDALDRCLAEKGGLSLSTIKNMSVARKAVELRKISAKISAVENDAEDESRLLH
jgi:hypothetical protein